MKKLLALVLCISLAHVSSAQEATLYNPAADATADINKKIAEAKKDNKFVLIQAGGNWCGWCLEFNRFTHADAQIDSIIKSAFVVYHLNYSKENYNLPIFKKYDYPQRFGFPVFIILKADGSVLHIQDSGLLVDGKKSYDERKVKNFFMLWSPAAFNAKQYQQ